MTLTKGTLRKDGFTFYGYQTRDGKTYERWLSPEAVANAKARNAKWREANRDKAYASYAAWYQKNKERHNAMCRAWRKRQKVKAK